MNKRTVTRLLSLSALWVLLAVSVLAFRPAPAQAAAGWKKVPTDKNVLKVGKYYFKTAEDGGILFSTSTNGTYTVADRAQNGAMTNGTYIVYIREEKGMQQLCRYTIKSRKLSILKKFPESKDDPNTGDSDFFRLSTINGNLVYVSRGSFSQWKYWEYTYNLKTKKWKTVLTGGYIQDIYGKYAIIDHDYRTDVSPSRMSIYQITGSGSLKKVRELDKNCANAQFVGGKIYFAAYPGGKTQKLVLYRCNPNGKSLKKMATFTSKEKYSMVLTWDYTSKGCKVNIDSKTYQYTYNTKKLKFLSTY